MKRANFLMGLLLVALVWSGEAMAATYVSIATGNWSSTNTWAVLKTGTITTSTASTTVTGVGTLFTTQFANGQRLYTANGVLIGTIASRASNTSLTLTANAASANTNIAYYGTATATPTTTADSVTVAHNVTLDTDATIAGLTVNTGVTLTDDGNTRILTVTGNMLVNGTVTGTTGNGVRINVTGATSTISGSGTFASTSRLYVSGASVTIAAGSVLNFTGSSRIYTGRTAGGSNALTSVLTINGTINSTVPTATTTFLRLYANSTVIGVGGAINASVSAVTYNNSTAKLTNNGSVSVNRITQNAAGNAWTQGIDSSLTVSAASSFGTASATTGLNASANNNTVTYNSPASPITPSSNTYFNLAGTGVICPVPYTILGTSPCTASLFVQGSPSSCSSVTGVGSIAWTNSANVYTSNNVYATAATGNGNNITTNYLNCTGFNLNVPSGATISGITVYVERKTSGGTVRDAFVYLIKGGAISTAFNASTATNYTTADAIEAHGGQANLWGTTWTAADVNSTTTFGVAFAAIKTSNNARNITVDHIQVRVDYTTSSTDHVSVSAPSVGSTCSASNVAIAAHTTAHTAPTSAVGTIRLTTSDNRGDWAIVTGTGTLANGTANDGLATYAYATGETSVTLGLTHTNAATITIGVANNATGTSLLTNTPAGELANSITYVAGGFTITDAAGVAIVSMTQVAGQISPTYYLKATNTSCNNAFNNVVRNIDMAFECNDPTTCQAPVVTITNATTSATTALPAGVSFGTNPATATYSAVSLNFNASSLAPFKLTSPDVGKISLYFRYTTLSLLGESNPFVVKPAGFVLSAIKCTTINAANCGAGALVMPTAGDNPGATSAVDMMPAPNATVPRTFIRAGHPFTARVTAVNAVGAATPNYGREVSPESVKLTPTNAVAGMVSPPAVNGTFGAFSNGIATGTAFTWDEVGIITLTPSVLDADYLGAGNITGTVSGNVGRFYPHHFAITPNAPPIENRADVCSDGVLVSDGVTPCAPTFTYIGEQMDVNFTLTAQSLSNITTQNYTGAFAKLNLAAANPLGLGAVDTTVPTYLTARLDTSLPASGVFATGSAAVVAPFAITRGVAPDGPYAALDIGIAPVDTDGVALGGFDLDTDATAGDDHVQIGTTAVRYGRIKLSNAHGSELLQLPITATVQFWNGANYVTSADDDETQFDTQLKPAGNIQADIVKGPLVPGNVSVVTPGLVTFANGVNTFRLGAPNVAGSVDLSIVTAPSYLLPSTTGRATFGVYKGANEFIYLRENY